MTCRTKSGASGSCHSCGPWLFEWLESLEGFSDDAPKDLIGLDEDGSSEDRLKVCPKDVIGRDKDGRSEDCPKVCPEDVIGVDEDRPSEDRPKVRPKDVIGRDEDGPSEVSLKESGLQYTR